LAPSDVPALHSLRKCQNQYAHELGRYGGVGGIDNALGCGAPPSWSNSESLSGLAPRLLNHHDLALSGRPFRPGAAFILGAGASAPGRPHIRAIGECYRESWWTDCPAFLHRQSLAAQDCVIYATGTRSSGRTSRSQGVEGRGHETATIAAILEQIISRSTEYRCHNIESSHCFHSKHPSSALTGMDWRSRGARNASSSHPHGIVQRMFSARPNLMICLLDTQDIDEPLARHWYLPGLVLPGEERSSSPFS